MYVTAWRTMALRSAIVGIILLSPYTIVSTFRCDTDCVEGRGCGRRCERRRYGRGGVEGEVWKGRRCGREGVEGK
ncbi:hypothetical protein B0O80DRAFT_450013, partial [Mortierella sp. GBAus27b]